MILQQREAQTHELELGISLPEQLMAWRRVVVASEIASNLERDPHDEAESVLRELVDVGVDDPRLYESLYRLHVVAGRHEEARKLRDELMADGTQVEGDLRGLRLYEY